MTPSKSAALVLAAALLSSSGCGSSPDPKLRAEIDALARNVLVSDARYVGKVPLRRLPPAVGQWVEYLAYDDEGYPFRLRQEVVGQQGEAFWIQQEQTTYQDRTWLKLLVANLAAPAPMDVFVKRVIHRDREGNEVELPENVEIWTEYLRRHGRFDMNIDKAVTITVPAGVFENTFTQQVPSPPSDPDDSLYEWLNSEVPIWGIVRAAATYGQSRWELVAFGLTGANDVFTSK